MIFLNSRVYFNFSVGTHTYCPDSRKHPACLCHSALPSFLGSGLPMCMEVVSQGICPCTFLFQPSFLISRSPVMGAPFCLLLHQATLISTHTYGTYLTQVSEPWTSCWPFIRRLLPFIIVYGMASSLADKSPIKHFLFLSSSFKSIFLL